MGLFSPEKLRLFSPEMTQEIAATPSLPSKFEVNLLLQEMEHFIDVT